MNTRRKFGKLYDRYVEEIYRFIFLKVSTTDIAEDLTSETFRKGWEVFQESPDMKNPRAYLYQIARNLVIDHYRTKKSHLSPEDIELVDDGKNMVDQATVNTEMEKVKTAMENINDTYKDVIILRYLEEMEISEVAKIMDKSEGAIRVLTHRALKTLEEELEKMKDKN